MNFKYFALSMILAAFVVPSSTLAKSNKPGKQTADRTLASELAASLTVVAGEGRRFADSRDELARLRMQNMQDMENATLWVQQGNDFDVMTWEVVGEAYRQKLYKAVITATDDIASKRAATAERQDRQRQELAAAASAVSVKTSQLLSAAGSLATLAEPPPSGEAMSALIKTTLSQLTASLGDEDPKLKQGLELAGGVLDKVLP